MMILKLKPLILASLCCLVFAGSGCKNTYKEQSEFKLAPKLQQDNRIFVAMPFDAVFKGRVMFKSGKNVASTISEAFGRYGRGVFVSKQPQSLSESMESARGVRAEYLIYPTIVTWEDRATEWSAMRDKLVLRMDVIEVANGQTVYSRTVTGRGKWMTEGGDTPSDLLDDPVESFANDLYKKHEIPSGLN
ncbi:MAG: DUF4823 domain-containing protein [Verrucomicrobiales bacterium]